MSDWQRRSDTRDPLTILCEREGVPCLGCRHYLEIAGEKHCTKRKITNPVDRNCKLRKDRK